MRRIDRIVIIPSSRLRDGQWMLLVPQNRGVEAGTIVETVPEPVVTAPATSNSTTTTTTDDNGTIERQRTETYTGP
jgi:hypothetical protein